MIHPIIDFKALFPEAFNTLVRDYMGGIRKYKNGSFVCPECGDINPIYYNSGTESYKTVKEFDCDLIQKHCESCGYKEPRKELSRCLFCNRNFMGYGDAKYCSHPCFLNDIPKVGDVRCEVCKVMFHKNKYQINRTSHNYCSQACFKELRPKRISHRKMKMPREFEKGDVIKNRYGTYRVLKIFHLNPSNSSVLVPKIKVTFTDGQKIHWARYKVDSERKYEILGL